MLKNIKTKKIIKILAGSFVAAAIGVGIGLGHHYTFQSNPYTQYFKRPTNYGDVSLEQSYQAAVLNGASVLIGAGFSHNNIISKINSEPAFKDVSFLGIDVAFSGKNAWNVSTVNFKTEQSGFFAAIAAAEYLNQNQNYFLKPNQDFFSYSAWGGISGQSVDSYLSGFQQGIIYYNKTLLPLLNKSNVKTRENKSYKKIYLAMPTKFYSGGFGVGDANSIIDEIITGNCTLLEPDGSPYIGTSKSKVTPDIVFPVAGPQTATLVTKIYTNNSRIAVVGVDTAMENDPMTTKDFNTNGQFPILNGKECKSIIPFSAIKDIENSTNGILNNILNGITQENDKDSGGFGGLGWYSVGDIKNNGAGISQNGEESITKIMIQSGLLNNDNSTYQNVKDYFTTQYNINDLTILKPEVINNNKGNKGNYVPLRDPGWLIQEQDGETQESFEIRKQEFINNTNKFAQQISKKLKTLQNEPNKNSFKNSIKIILSTPTSVLFDHSFSETAYLGLYKFYKNAGAPIPAIK